MTIPVNADSTTLLTRRLAALRAERTEVADETRLASNGDIADRATNVEASIRVQLLDERIASLELEIADAGQRQHVEGFVSVGDVVTLDLGDGDETYLIGSVEQAAAGVDTITPASPLGRAILGAEVGSTISFEPRRGVDVTVEIRATGEVLRPSA